MTGLVSAAQHSNDSALGWRVVRALRPEDRAAVVRILSSTRNFRPDEAAIALELFDLGTAADGASPLDPDYQWIGVQDEGELAGVACFGPTPATEGTFDLYWIAVASPNQGRGLGGALLARVESAVDQLGGRLLVVETSSASPYDVPRVFYANRGYILQATVRDYFGPGDNRLILTQRRRPAGLSGEVLAP